MRMRRSAPVSEWTIYRPEILHDVQVFIGRIWPTEHELFP
jgi:hypothetical protein